MATTTNYGWSTPDDSALVKDGASAIRTLGSSVDTTVKALSPGTTAGDIDYYTSSTAKSRIAIGSSGQVLTVSGGIPAWATASSGGMTLLSTTTLSGTSTTVSSISQSYTNLYIVIKGASSSAGYRPKFFTAGTSGGNYVAIMYAGSGAVESDFLGSASTNFGTGTGNAIVINIYDYTATTFKSATMGGGSSQSINTAFFASGVIGTTSAISSITYTTTAGTATFSGGTMLIYGVK
jgi:hypothetical protein